MRKMIEQICFTMTMRFSASFGATAVASAEIARQCWSVLSILWWPLSVAGQTMVAAALAEFSATQRHKKLVLARGIADRRLVWQARRLSRGVAHNGGCDARIGTQANRQCGEGACSRRVVRIQFRRCARRKLRVQIGQRDYVCRVKYSIIHEARGEEDFNLWYIFSMRHIFFSIF